jgi:hypothetical protein
LDRLRVLGASLADRRGPAGGSSPVVLSRSLDNSDGMSNTVHAGGSRDAGRPEAGNAKSGNAKVTGERPRIWGLAATGLSISASSARG